MNFKFIFKNNYFYSTFTPTLTLMLVMLPVWPMTLALPSVVATDIPSAVLSVVDTSVELTSPLVSLVPISEVASLLETSLPTASVVLSELVTSPPILVI